MKPNTETGRTLQYGLRLADHFHICPECHGRADCEGGPDCGLCRNCQGGEQDAESLSLGPLFAEDGP